ncbi:MAG TPA: tetratricopeptide repeat protein [Candidatus Binatia bacterium]|nr:tetratricopeptide repeat protein [Candidatus Binatia bacterium]
MRAALVCLVLVGAVCAIYGQSTRFDFSFYDDPDYVTENEHVRSGLTWANVEWALTTSTAANWHPLTWMSHMLDVELFGLDAGRHHAINVALHAANALLLFAALRASTGAFWRSAVVAGVFAVHPVNVESVAWISERKTELCALFGFLALWAYAGFARRGGVARYLAVAGAFALSLLAKPMLVTLPLLFLVLDFWPLARFRLRGAPIDSASPPAAGEPPSRPGTIAWLVLEKVPLLLLVAASSAAAVLAQRAGIALMPSAALPLGARLANAAVSYVDYVRIALWPARFSVLYPHPDLAGGTPLGGWQVAGAVALLVAVSCAAVALAARRPYVLVGWLWFVGTLVPMIGLVQVGVQARADRYLYVPLVGLAIVAVWGGADLLRAALPSASARRAISAAIAAGLLLALSVRAFLQTRVWRDSISLCETSLATTPTAIPLLDRLATLYVDAGRWDDAIAVSHRALALSPGSFMSRLALGNALRMSGRGAEAVDVAGSLVREAPDGPDANVAMGLALESAGRAAEAVPYYRTALRARPGDAAIHYNLGNALLAAGRPAEAIPEFAAAIAARPDLAEAHVNLGAALVRLGHTDEASEQFRQAVRIDPQLVVAQFNLAAILAYQGRLDEARERLAALIAAKPDLAQARSLLVQVLERQGKDAEARRVERGGR